VGQSHLLGEGRPLRLAFQSGQPHSMIFWGPPGVGKTTLARLTAAAFDAEFIALSAVFSGVKDIRGAIEQAEHHRARGRRTILFVDEIHRFNKAQQDALLPYAESGLVTFIGATTENPSFEVNAALLSRSQVYVLEPLGDEELRQLFERVRTRLVAHATAADRVGARASGGLGGPGGPGYPGHAGQPARDIAFATDAVDAVIALADGDARRFLHQLQQCHAAAMAAGVTQVDAAFVQRALTAAGRRFDKGGDAFYDQISALHKSVRGSNPDAALYWLCRMLDGGADARYLARRIVRMAWEDIGLADPRAMQLANDAATTYERLGSPEGELALAQAVIYLAVAAKSNAGYNAFNAARAFVQGDRSRPVPAHLRNAPTALMKALGHGRDYRYAHDEAEGYAAGERYLPEGMAEPGWYRPVPRGLESKIAEKLARLRELDRQADPGS
jgi:putative ATPase